MRDVVDKADQSKGCFVNISSVMSQSSTSSDAGASGAAACPVCLGGRTDAYVEKDGFTFRICPSCGYIFCHPRPTQAELATHYAPIDADGNTVAGRDFYPKASSRKRRGYFNALKLLPHVWGKRVLDLGCGGGFVVGGMKAVGAREAVGLDINAGSIAYARAHFPKCEFVLGTFGDFADGKLGTFDFVYSSEVIEHVEDVEAYMHFLSEVTKAGAKVFITTPDISCDLVPETVTDWDVFSPPFHIQFFTEATLVHLFGRFGFMPVKRIPDPGGAGLKMLFRKTA